ncbi:MAG: hypothetical protein ACFCBW_19820 [Candidatus Competibacterales bacterium]
MIVPDPPRPPPRPKTLAEAQAIIDELWPCVPQVAELQQRIETLERRAQGRLGVPPGIGPPSPPPAGVQPQPVVPRGSTVAQRLGKRLREPSTWRGVIVILSVLGITLSPEQQHAIIATGIALAGLVEVFRAES